MEAREEAAPARDERGVTTSDLERRIRQGWEATTSAAAREPEAVFDERK
jgi:hypothetical protein